MKQSENAHKLLNRTFAIVAMATTAALFTTDATASIMGNKSSFSSSFFVSYL